MENEEANEAVRKRLDTVKSCPGPKGCASCDCYYLLLFYIMEELSDMDNPGAKALLSSITKEFQGRKKLKLHGCRGCNPCNPAEWAAELVRKKGQKEK